MDLQREIEKKIERKQQEIGKLESELSQARAILESLLDIAKLIQRSPVAIANRNGEDSEMQLRHGSDVAKAREFLEKVGGAHHINSILKGIGKENTRKARASLGSQLNVYARRGMVFKKHGPNVFGIMDLNGGTNPVISAVENASIPPNFGKF